MGKRKKEAASRHLTENGAFLGENLARKKGRKKREKKTGEKKRNYLPIPIPSKKFSYRGEVKGDIL